MSTEPRTGATSQSGATSKSEATSQPDTTPQSGVLGRPRRRLGGNSIWNWLDLGSKIAIPLVVIIVTIGFGWWQTQLADQQHKNDQRLAEQQHNADQKLADKQQQAAIVQTYIGNMQDLLLHHRLSEFKPGGSVYRLAKEQTIFTLGRLDWQHNTIVLQLLQNAGLDGLLDLSNADLSNDQLNDAHLNGIGLIGTTLTAADMSKADLSDATMYGADLSDANLSNATITSAALSDAVLTHADMRGAHLSNATLVDADLTDARLDGATLTAVRLDGAHLSHADLSRAVLSGANLTGADLSKANLSGADLTGAFLKDANLKGANLKGTNLSDVRDAPQATQLQSDAAPSCPGNMPPKIAKKAITLTYWYTESGPEACAVLEQISRFERLNPDIRIKPVQKQFLQTRAALTAAVQRGAAPDVWRSDVGWVTLFASKGYLLNIDSYVSQRDLSDYKKAPLNAALAYDEYDGHLYGLPQVTDFLALLYNRNELKRAGINHPPTTMTELRTDAKKIVQRKNATYGFETSGTSYYALPFLYAFGGGMFDQHNNIVVDSDRSVKGLQFLVSLENTDHIMPPKADPSSGPENMTKDFMNGTTAMIFDGPFAVSQILTGTSFTRDHGNLGIAAIPAGPSGQTGSPLGGQSYVISAGTAHPWEAYSFIKYMSSQPVQIAIAKQNHTLPTRQSAYQGSGVSSDPFISAFLKIKKTAVARPAIPQGRYLFDIFDPSIWASLIGVQSPNDALSTVADDWRQLGAGRQGP